MSWLRTPFNCLRRSYALLLLILATGSFAAGTESEKGDGLITAAAITAGKTCMNIYQFSAPDLITNKPVDFCEAYKGKVLIIVNTASKCAFTGQYEGLEALYKEYADQGLVVLGFPSNQFGNQEPGDAEQIHNFCRVTYGVQFPMFAKSRVSKSDADPLWTYLGETTGTYPRWNFYKYLINRQGEVVEVFSSITSPDSKRFHRAVKALLKAESTLQDQSAP